MKTSLTLASLIAVVIAAPAFAQAPNTGSIDRREASQERRIEQGVKSGQLTQQEAAKLEKGQDRIQKMENKAKADGVVTQKESARIQKAQDKQSRKIYKEKHDNQRDMNHDGKRDKKRDRDHDGKRDRDHRR